MTNDFDYYEFEVGRENYKPETNKLVWNVIVEDNNKIQVRNIFEYNSVFTRELSYAKKHYSKDYDKFSEHIRSWLQHEYWSRCEYEITITSFPPYITKAEVERLSQADVKYRAFVNLEQEQKIDVCTQVMINWDRFIEYVWNNKELINDK